MSKNSIKLRKFVLTSILSALGALLMLIQIPYIIPFLKFDVSEVVVLISYLTLGLVPSIIVAFIKSVMNGLVFGPVGPMYIGQLTAFVASIAFVLFYHVSLRYLFKKIKTNMRKNILSLSVMVIGVVLVMTFLNYYYITPVYILWDITATVKDITSSTDLTIFAMPNNFSYEATVLAAYLPFNLIKGFLVAIVFLIIDRNMSTFLKKYIK